MSGYRSDIDIRIGQMPEIKDNPPVFSEMQQVYNALHILNSAVNSLNKRGGECSPESREDFDPWETFNFECKSFWAPAANNVKQGHLVKMSGSQWVPGVEGASTLVEQGALVCNGTLKRAYRYNTVDAEARDFGFCVEETVDGYALIAWPPFIVEIEGISVGNFAYGNTTDGRIFSNAPNSNYFPVGRIVAPNALLLQHRMAAREERKVYTSYWSECHGGGGR